MKYREETRVPVKKYTVCLILNKIVIKIFINPLNRDGIDQWLLEKIIGNIIIKIKLNWKLKKK